MVPGWRKAFNPEKMGQVARTRQGAHAGAGAPGVHPIFSTHAPGVHPNVTWRLNRILWPRLAGLHGRLQNRLRPEPCQTVLHLRLRLWNASGALRFPLTGAGEVEPRFRGSARLRLAFFQGYPGTRGGREREEADGGANSGRRPAARSGARGLDGAKAAGARPRRCGAGRRPLERSTRPGWGGGTGARSLGGAEAAGAPAAGGRARRPAVEEADGGGG